MLCIVHTVFSMGNNSLLSPRKHCIKLSYSSFIILSDSKYSLIFVRNTSSALRCHLFLTLKLQTAVMFICHSPSGEYIAIPRMAFFNLRGNLCFLPYNSLRSFFSSFFFTVASQEKEKGFMKSLSSSTVYPSSRQNDVVSLMSELFTTNSGLSQKRNFGYSIISSMLIFPLIL